MTTTQMIGMRLVHESMKQAQVETISDGSAVENAKAVRLYPALAALDLDKVPVVSRDRHIARKFQAQLARALFRNLKLPGISVTTPNYSMAQSVDVRIPKLSRHDAKAWQHHGRDEQVLCRSCQVERDAKAKVQAILAAAFPNHDDRSDSQSDYFDYCWSID